MAKPILQTLALALITAPAFAQLPPRVPAFPGAEGAGAWATGGRYGEVYRVTNLNASGPGSLADAVSRPNRFVVFAVSGVIQLNGRSIGVKHPNITIAGQTAPGEGICLAGGALHVTAGNVIVRYIRSRRGHVQRGNMGDAMTAKGRFEDVIFDHVSASWATDENLPLTNANRVTGQWFLNAEALDYFNINQSPNRHAFGSLFGSQTEDGRMTIHHSIYAHNRLRNARTTGGDHGGTPPTLQFLNNIVYDAKELTSHTGSQPIHGNWIGNYVKDGPSTGIEGHDVKGVLFTIENSADNRLYLAGNHIESYPDRTRDNWLAVRYKRVAASPAFRAGQPFPAPEVAVQPALEAYDAVLEDAGATLPARDPIDTRIVNDIRSGTGAVLNFETDLTENARRLVYHALEAPADADADGMPDFWERQYGLDPANPGDAMADPDGDGYVNIEEYANNTQPRGETAPVVYVSAWDSRAHRPDNEPAQFKLWRNGPLEAALRVRYTLNGQPEAAEIPAGAAWVKIELRPSDWPGADRVTLEVGDSPGYFLGCPRAALAAIEDFPPPPPADVKDIDPRGGVPEEEYSLGAAKYAQHNKDRKAPLEKRRQAAKLEQPWLRRTIDNSSRGADGVKLGDINKDGYPDIATGWEEGGAVRVYLNPGPLAARLPWRRVTVGHVASPEDAVFFDVDHDGALDVVSATEGKERRLYVHWAPKEPRRLLDPEAWSTAVLPAADRAMAWMYAAPAQIDGRHGLDLFAGGKGADGAVGWFEAPANPRDLAGWQWHPLRKSGWTMSLIPRDMDGDGDADLLLSNRRREDIGVYWLENPGPGAGQTQPWRQRLVGSEGRQVMFVTAADLDGDGLEDVIAAVQPRELHFHRRLARDGARWETHVVPMPANTGIAKAVRVADVNLDGRRDLVFSCEETPAGQSGVMWMSFKRPPFDPEWEPHDISGPEGIKFDWIELADLDGDGDLDVVTTEERAQLGVIWYENPARRPRESEEE